MVRFETACLSVLYSSASFCVGEIASDVGKPFCDRYETAFKLAAHSWARESEAWTVFRTGERPFECSERASNFFGVLCLAALQLRSVESAKEKSSSGSSLAYQLSLWGWKASRAALSTVKGRVKDFPRGWLDAMFSFQRNFHAQTLLAAAEFAVDDLENDKAAACLDALESSGVGSEFAPRARPGVASSVLSKIKGVATPAPEKGAREKQEDADREQLEDLGENVGSFRSRSRFSDLEAVLPKEPGFFFLVEDLARLEGFEISLPEARKCAAALARKT